MHKPSAVPVIKVGAGAWERLRNLLGCETDTALARRLGVDQSQISRVRWGRTDLSLILVARIQDALLADGIELADLFWLTRADGTAVPLIVACPGAVQRGGVSPVPERKAS